MISGWVGSPFAFDNVTGESLSSGIVSNVGLGMLVAGAARQKLNRSSAAAPPIDSKHKHDNII